MAHSIKVGLRAKNRTKNKFGTLKIFNFNKHQEACTVSVTQEPMFMQRDILRDHPSTTKINNN